MAKTKRFIVFVWLWLTPLTVYMPVSLVFAWVGVASGVLARLLDLLGLFFSSSRSQGLSLSEWTLQVVLKGGFSTVTDRLLTQRLSI